MRLLALFRNMLDKRTMAQHSLAGLEIIDAQTFLHMNSCLDEETIWTAGLELRSLIVTDDT